MLPFYVELRHLKLMMSEKGDKNQIDVCQCALAFHVQREQTVLFQAHFDIFFVRVCQDDEMKTHFLKVHAPWDTLCKTAEEMMMQMPIKV